MSDEIKTQEGALEKPSDAGKGVRGEVRRWLLDLDLQSEDEKKWRESAQNAVDVYRQKKKPESQQFNILWANVEVMRPNVYNSLPRPDVRDRSKSGNPVVRKAAEVLERALAYEIDTQDYDNVINGVVLDFLIPCRGVIREKFEPKFQQKPQEGQADPVDVLSYACVRSELVPWDRFRRGPGSTWDEVPWVAYLHLLTRSDIEKQFPGYSSKVSYDWTMDGADKKKAEVEPSIYKRVMVWEIWDKDNREILWLAPSLKANFLKREEDKLKLTGFFDCPRPLYSVESPNTLVPAVEYDMYRDQAKELNRITRRINGLIEACRVRGIYDATIKEMEQLLSSNESDLIPSSSATIAMQAGGMDKAIYLLPIDQIAKVLAQLYVARDQVKMVIYEVVGIADIMRGTSDPNETLGAQEIKAQTGSVRMQRRQRELQRLIRDSMRIKAEIIAENYTPELLQLMTGIQITPEILQVLRSDALRGFNIDIETDSTIAGDQMKDRKMVAELLEAFSSSAQAMGPMIESGAISMETAKKVFVSIIRKAKLGREVEDAIDTDAQRPPQPKPDPEMAKMQGEMQMKQAQMQMDGQKAQAEMQMQQAKMQGEQQLAQIKIQSEQQVSAEKLASEQQLQAMKIESDKQVALAKAASEAQLAREKMTAELSIKREVEMLKIAAQVYTAQMTAESDEDGEKSAPDSKMLAPLMDTLKGLTEAFKAPRRIKTPDGREYTATQ